MVVDWVAPDSRGAEITSYQILFEHQDGTTYSQQLSYCDGSDPDIVTATTCTIPSSVFTQAPFNLPWGSEIFSKVIATNFRGDSLESEAGNGARIITKPDAPLNLANNLAVTTSEQIGLTWSQGLANGGTPVIDYKLSYAAGSNPYQTLEAGIMTLSYTAINLDYGVTYKFKV